ncbi:MAG: galactose mutarotase [Planctomycetes bacterium]|jgi:aldose 1-epimerase|nr:galactose mutarotase [Planctomycetota bacterium]
MPVNAHKESFGQTADGQEVFVYTLANSKGLRARITNYGATLVSLYVPDRNGHLEDIVLGFDDLQGYIQHTACMGATVGRYANRIGGAKFTLDGAEYTLAANNGPNHLHGGIKGFDKVVWETKEAVAADDEAWVKMSYLSVDGEEGYPGNLQCTVTYTLTNADELRITYEAHTDKKTVLNLTNHSYWNLAGQGSGDILGHELMLHAEKFTLIDKGLIPTGIIASVFDMPLDFTRPRTIGSRMRQTGNGYDHNYVLKGTPGELRPCADVHEPKTGRVMEIHTTEPGVQLYTGNFLDGSIPGKGGSTYDKHAGFCLETQHYPDSPNKPNFPSTVLEPGQTFTSRTVHRFSTK